MEEFMKRKQQLWLSNLAVVLVVFLHLGATVAKASLHDDDTPDKTLEKGDGIHRRLVVDQVHGRLGGECTNVDPCARITDALTIARAMRYGFDSAIPKLNKHERINITVRRDSQRASSLSV
jgi:hypothetical protein